MSGNFRVTGELCCSQSCHLCHPPVLVILPHWHTFHVNTRIIIIIIVKVIRVIRVIIQGEVAGQHNCDIIISILSLQLSSKLQFIHNTTAQVHTVIMIAINMTVMLLNIMPQEKDMKLSKYFPVSECFLFANGIFIWDIIQANCSKRVEFKLIFSFLSGVSLGAWEMRRDRYWKIPQLFSLQTFVPRRHCEWQCSPPASDVSHLTWWWWWGPPPASVFCSSDARHGLTPRQCPESLLTRI